MKPISWDNSCFDVDDLSPLSKELFGTLDGFQFDLNLYSMSNYSVLFKKLREIFEPQKIAEIGVFEAKFSEYLIETFAQNNTQFHFVDVDFNVEAENKIRKLASKYGVGFDLYEEMSTAYLERKKPVDWLFIDGDHNYETVSRELELANTTGKKLIVCHDTGWPCARWDSAYCPENLMDPEQYSNGMVSPFEGGVVHDYGLALPPVKVKESKDKSGVLTAVEDFLGENSSYSNISFKAFFGLTILWNRDEFSPADNERIANLGRCADVNESFVKVLELNRVMLLIMLQRSGRIWRKQKDYIDTLENRLREIKE